MKKKRNPKTLPTRGEGSTAAGEIKSKFRKFNWRLALTVFLWLVGAVGVYQLCNYFEIMFHAYAYPVVIGLLAGAYILLNGGFSKELPTDAELPPLWDGEQRRAYIKKVAKRKKLAKKLLIPLFAMIAAVFLDILVISLSDGSLGIS